VIDLRDAEPAPVAAGAKPAAKTAAKTAAKAAGKSPGKQARRHDAADTGREHRQPAAG
jgi:hypothetical protein